MICRIMAVPSGLVLAIVALAILVVGTRRHARQPFDHATLE